MRPLVAPFFALSCLMSLSCSPVVGVVQTSCEKKEVKPVHINGVTTTEEDAGENAQILSNLLGTTTSLYYNTSDKLVLDLYQSA
ncbi:hypothetical protein EBR03_10425, partial [bacterium]|nr:hypothetical protein [bacterium]